MAGFNYGRAQNTADRLIKKFGGAGVILKFVAPVDSRSKPTYTRVPVALVVIDYNNRQVDGTRILATDKQIFVSAKSIAEITPDDRVEDASGATYEIVPPVKLLDPSGSKNVLFEIQGRS
jgi:hypothetical protein